MPLSRGKSGTYADIAKDIFESVGRDNAELVYSIFSELWKDTPICTGALNENWHYGPSATGQIFQIDQEKHVPKSEFHRGTYDECDGVRTPVPAKKIYKKRWSKFYIWNNVPYLSYVNDGITWRGAKQTTPKTRANVNFVQKAILKGLKKSIGIGQSNTDMNI